jgi:hypothetical protein
MSQCEWCVRRFVRSDDAGPGIGRRWRSRNLHDAYCVLTVQMSGSLGTGHEGPCVARLPQALIDLRFLADVADGRYGPDTATHAVSRRFACEGGVMVGCGSITW